MKAIVKRPFEPVGRLKDIPNTLESLQNYVGGYIETVTLRRRPDVCIICDEEGLLNRKSHNCTIDGITFVGPIVVVGVDGDEFTDCPLALQEWVEMMKE